jgi:type IV pilus assembly protein PilO|tara:strand:+ start:397 stop:1038 length:642 start_codon:yes stop_codon:yes gene_type:complete
MAVQDLMESLQSFDMDQLSDFNNVGSWPIAVKIIMWVLAFVAVLAGGYFLHITKLQQELANVQNQEGTLRTDYEDKFAQAVHLNAYRQQQMEMEESFQAILEQLPSDTEIPGLIEDITLVGHGNGLTFSQMALQNEVRHEFYVEKPINIVVSGGYHDLGSFVSDVADLSRIVTLHDFSISPASGKAKSQGEPGSVLTMVIVAKTYRYNDERGL